MFRREKGENLKKSGALRGYVGGRRTAREKGRLINNGMKRTIGVGEKGSGGES